MTERAAIQVPCPWHREEMSRLMAQHQAGRLPHAVLLCGGAGIGKERLARAFLEALLCEAPQGGLACGQCRACRLTTAGTHPDYFCLEPEQQGKVLKVDQVRQLVEFAGRTAQFGGYRVALVMPAEAMNRNAQNALLKTLEEPGQDTLLLLLSHQPGLLLPTVRSRCQQRHLPMPAGDEALPWLRQQLGDEENAQALLTAAGGAPLRALALEQADWFAGRREILEALVAAAGGRVPVSQAVQPLLSGDPVTLLDALYGWSSEALRGALAARTPADGEVATLLNRLAGEVGAPRLLRFAEALVRARRALKAGANPNRELMFEELVLVLAGLELTPAAP